MFKCNKLLKNKKGNFDDINEVMIIIFLFVITLFIMGTVINKFGTQIKTNEITNQSTSAVNFIDKYETRYNKAWDYGFLVLLIVVPIFSFIMAKKIQIDTLNIIIAFLFIGFYLILGAIISNMHGKMLENTLYFNYMANLTIIPYFMPLLFYYAIIHSIIIFVGLFSSD